MANPPNREIGSTALGLAAEKEQNPAARRRGRDDGDETAEMEREEKEGDEDGDDQGDGNESEA